MKLTALVFALALASCGATQTTNSSSEMAAVSTSNEIVVQGPVASKIIKALSATELKKSPIGGGFQIGAKDVLCTYTPRGFIYAQCSLTEVATKAATGIYPVGQVALELMNALKDAGVPVHESPSATIQSTGLNAKSVACTSGGFVAGSHCVITVK